MSAQLFVAKEIAAGEFRVAATPETVKKYIKDGLTVLVESNAGAGANIADKLYQDAGASIASDGRAAWSSADLVLKIAPPSVEEANRL
ncbi:MAG TPA: hypothetical protein VGI70_06790, partial [Polyangiales bacterium]